MNFEGISAHDGARQHNGNNYNSTVNNYIMRQRAAEQVARTNKALLQAASTGQIARVKALIEKGADPEHADEYGLTALHHASVRGLESVVTALLALDVDVDAYSEVYGTPLCLAALKGHGKVVKLLLDTGANVHADGGLLGSALHAASYAAENNDNIVKLLIDRGLKPTVSRIVSINALLSTLQLDFAQTESGKLCALCQPLIVACEAGNIGAVETLLTHGAAVDAPCERWMSKTKDATTCEEHEKMECTALMWATLTPTFLLNKTNAVSALLRRGANVNAKASNGLTALMFAAMSDRVDLMRTMIERGADIATPRPGDGMTPLMVAAKCGSVKALRLLLESGASTTTCDKQGWNALVLAADSGMTECVDVLTAKAPVAHFNARLQAEKAEDLQRALIRAAAEARVDCVSLLLRKGGHKVAQNPQQPSPLLMATINEHESIVEMLLEAGVDPNVQSMKERMPPLTLTVMDNNIGIARLLVAYGANVHLKDMCGLTPLDHAKSEGNKEMLHLILDASRTSKVLSYAFDRGLNKLLGI